MLCEDVWPPGFRFHPTDEELILYYLKRKISRRSLKLDIIAEVDVYKCEPEELPGLSVLKNGDRQWFFFSPRDRKYPNGSRASRATRQGYWKATGKDRIIACNSRNVGIKKTLVFYKGRAPTGQRTDWVMHEYLLEEDELKRCQNVHDYFVIYKLFKKSGPGPKNGEQYGAPFKEEDWAEDDCPQSYDQFCTSQQVVSVSPNYSCRNAQADCSVSDIGELLNYVPDEPAPLPVNNQSALLQVNEPTPLQVTNEPAPVNMDDFEEVLSQFLGQDNQSTVTNLSFEEANKIVVEDDFIEMDDLLGPEPVQGLSNPQPTGGENPDNSQFQVEDGLSVFDVYCDADVDLLDLASNDQTPVQCTTSQDSGSVNRADVEVLCYSSQVGLQSYSDGISCFGSETCFYDTNADGISSFGGETWSYDASPGLVNCTETYKGFTPSPLPSTGVVCGGNSTELNQNQEVERPQPWSSTLWSFVDSIPAAPASAAESILLNKAFQRMSSFGRVRTDSRNTVSPDGGSVISKPSSVVGVSGRMKGYFFASLLAALFAIACVFLGSYANIFGTLRCRMHL